MAMNNDENTPKVTATTPPIAPTEPAPIPLEEDVEVDLSNSNDNRDKYYCPMHCEGDKMYDSPGNCPVCGMRLVKHE